MKNKPRFEVLAAAVLLAGLASTAVAAPPPPPSGPHPRIFLTPAVLAALKVSASKPGSATAQAIALCQHAVDKPGDFSGRGYQGDGWSYAASACALAWQVTGKPAFAAAGVSLWKTLLGDVNNAGDGLACSSPAVNQAQAINSIKADTGYAIRFIGPHSALAYDWLHDAPGVDESMRAWSRYCFQQWLDYYTRSGYHRDQPGSNYHAGFTIAKTLVAVAEGSEDGATSDRLWSETVNDLFGTQLVGRALAGIDGAPGTPAGVMVGGDWAEGWQYGPLSVEEYAFAARALEEQGVALPQMDAWASSLVLRFFYGMTPARDGTYVGGDLESHQTLYQAVTPGVLTAVLTGPTSAQAAGYAAQAQTSLGLKPGSTVWEAVGEARSVTPSDFYKSGASIWYLSRGARNLYARTSWDPSAYWAVFTGAPHLVDDHQHVDASNFVFSRGADHLVVDPTTYGSRSTMASNALSIDSDVVQGDYRPSQTPWSTAELTWARGTQSGTFAARADVAAAFSYNGTPSDIHFARRDWVMLPEGEVVTIDRADTPDAAHKMYLRFRSIGKLQLAQSGAAYLATADVGGSTLAIHSVSLSGGTPTVRAPMVSDNNECFNVKPFGACDLARLPVTELNLVLPGPHPLAIHVLDALAKGAAPAVVSSINDPANDPQGHDNAAVLGAAVFRASTQTFVVASSGPQGSVGATMAYGVPGANPSRHVVFDAPADSAGKATVAAQVVGDRCMLAITAGGTMDARPLMFGVGTAAGGCKVADDPSVMPGTVPPGDGTGKSPMDGGAGFGRDLGAAGDAGINAVALIGGCQLATRPTLGAAWNVVFGLAVIGGLLLRPQWRPRRASTRP